MLPKTYRPLCDFCGIICGLVWFQQKPPVTTLKATEIPEMILCIKCYTDGNFPNILSANDFIKCDLLSKLASNESQPSNRQSWTTEETNRLLDLISKNHENWTEIEKQMGGNRTKEEIILHFLQLPLKNISSVQFLFENEEENPSKLPIESLLENNEPTVFSDFSNPLLQHVAIFKNLLEKVKNRKKSNVNYENSEGKNLIIKEETKNSLENQGEKGMEIEFDKENKEKIEDFDRKLERILNFTEKEEEIMMSLEKETVETAKNLQNKEENKMRMIVNLLIDLQLSKLESKLTYLEEFEKLIWYEKTELEVLQRMNIAERVNLAFKKNELNKQMMLHSQNNHFLPHNSSFAENKEGDGKITEEEDGKEKEEEFAEMMQEEQEGVSKEGISFEEEGKQG